MKKLLILAAGSPSWKPLFVDSLNAYGIKPLGIAEVAQKNHIFEAKFTDLYGVSNLQDVDEVRRAAGWLHETHGFELVECFEEYWKHLEATIREDLGLPGRTRADLRRNCSKEYMKDVFRKAEVKVATGFSAETLEDCLRQAQGRRYPMFAKPDQGVGAQNTLRVTSPDDFLKLLKHDQSNQFVEKYLMEDFLEGEIATFDGLIDFDRRIVSCFHLLYPDVADIVSGYQDQCVRIARTCPEAIFDKGGKVVEAFDMRGEFFHIEFKQETDGLYGMDANTRLCGACAPWMYGTTVIDSIPDRWARMMAGERLEPKLTLDRFGAMVCRRDKQDVHFKPYRHSHEEVIRYLGDRFLYTMTFDHCFRDNLNSYAYFVKGDSMDELTDMRNYIHEPAR